MKFKILTSYFLIICLTLAWSVSCSHKPTKVWSGEYQYKASLGRTNSQIAVFLDHTLNLREDGHCDIEVVGYQTNERLICGTIKEGDDLHITFVSYPDGSVLNYHGLATYKPNEKLFTLRYIDGVLNTTWYEFRPDDKHTTGIHFKKATKE